MNIQMMLRRAVFGLLLFGAHAAQAASPGAYYVRVVLCVGKEYCLEHHLRTDAEVNHVQCIMSAWQAAMTFQMQQFPAWNLKESECVEEKRIRS